MIKYPLSQNTKSKTGKTLNEISIENILSGNISSEDIKISKETLLIQGNIAEQEGRKELKNNFVRASELVDIPDNELLRIYDKLRPNRATKEELMNIAKELISKYNAKLCANLIYETIEVYDKRGLLKI